jgi:hypothetical protein
MFELYFHHCQQICCVNAPTHRGYGARVVKNNFDEGDVLCLWGGIGTWPGGSTVIPLASLDEAQATLENINARSTKRQYPQART